MPILQHDALLRRKLEIFKADTFVDEGFKGISYELRLSENECLVDRRYYNRTNTTIADQGALEIPPGQLAFVSTREEFNLAYDLVGRFGLKFKFVRRGLVPLLTTFIEPGSKGPLFCPLYNASSDTITLRPGDELFTVMFHELAQSMDPKFAPQEYSALPSDVIDEHIKIRMVSTIELENRVKDVEKDVQSVISGQQRVIAFTVPVITATLLGALLQSMFGLFAITQSMTNASAGNPTGSLWVIIPSTLYCLSVMFVAFFFVLATFLRRTR